MDFAVDYLQNAPQEPCDVPHGPSIADDDLRLETSNLYGGSLRMNPFFPMIGAPFPCTVQVMMSPVNDSARAAHGESTVSGQCCT